MNTNNFSITVQNLFNGKTTSIDFPCDMAEATKQVLSINPNGANDLELVDYEADFTIDQINIPMFNEIAILTEAQYKAFLIFAESESLDEALSLVNGYEYIVYEGCESLGDVAYRFLENDGDFQELPDFVKRNFNYESYGEELLSGMSIYESKKHKAFITLF
jgi:Antirestriction protein (ArdA)